MSTETATTAPDWVSTARTERAWYYLTCVRTYTRTIPHVEQYQDTIMNADPKLALVLLALARYADTQFHKWASSKELAAYTGMNRSTLDSYLRRLREGHPAIVNHTKVGHTLRHTVNPQ